MRAEINQISQALERIASQYERISSSCPWGREELEDLDFFREYVTKGDRRFLSAFNGYRRLKPVATTLYENPRSPNLPASSCLKGFVFSGLRLAWSEYSKSGLNRETRGGAEQEESLIARSVAKRLVENTRLGRKEEATFEKLYKLISESKEGSELKESAIESMTTLLVANLLEKFLSKSVLSLEQNEVGKEVVQRFRSLLERNKGEFLKALGEAVASLKDSDAQDLLKEVEAIKRNKEKFELFLRFASRKHFEENPVDPVRARRIVAQGKPPGLTGVSAQAVEDLLQALLSTLTRGGTLRTADVSNIFSGAESMSLARKVFSYVRSLQPLIRDLENTKRLIDRLKEKISEASGDQGEKAGKGTPGNGSRNNNSRNNNRGNNRSTNQRSSSEKKIADLMGTKRKRYEELFRTIMNEILVLRELLDMLTRDPQRRTGPLGQAARALSTILSPLSQLLDEIAEILGLKKLWSVEGLLGLASEIALQVL